MKYYLNDECWVVLEPSNPDEVIQDFREDENLMYLMKIHKRIIYNIQAPLEWLHPEVSYVEVINFDVDFENGEVIINPEPDIEYKPLEDSKLMWALNKFHKVVYMYDAPIDWLPDGVRVLMIKNDNFNYPLNNLPPSLESLSICAYKYIYGMARCVFNYPLDNLPHNLRHLCLCDLLDYSHELNNLPPMLEYLELYYMKYNKKTAKQTGDGYVDGETEKYYKCLCSNVPNIFISDSHGHYMSEKKKLEFNNYYSKLPKDYKIYLSHY